MQKKLNDALKVALKDPDFIKKQEGLGAVVVTDKPHGCRAEHKKFRRRRDRQVEPGHQGRWRLRRLRQANRQPSRPSGAAFFMHPSLRLVDSITELGPGDAGCIAVSGSHGGISSARYAAAAQPVLSVFNDAGGGLDDAGVAALGFLQRQGLAACTVGHASARIGDAQSTYNDGIISRLNAQAAALGVTAGQSCRDAVETVRNVSRRPT